VRDLLFHLACSPPTGLGREESVGTAAKLVAQQTELLVREQSEQPKGPESPIERRLMEAIKAHGELPEPICQREFKGDAGQLITVADFVYEDLKIAIYCDGFAYHGTADKLAGDAMKRNHLQAHGWTVLTFWGTTILKYPDRCVQQIVQARQTAK
jgi:hypothetical protein